MRGTYYPQIEIECYRNNCTILRRLPDSQHDLPEQVLCNQRSDVDGAGTEGHADADLGCAAGDDVPRQDVDSDRGQEDGETAEKRGKATTGVRSRVRPACRMRYRTPQRASAAQAVAASRMKPDGMEPDG
jgi:hypothetical protein